MNQIKKIAAISLIVIGSVFAIQGIAQNVKLNPIKPGTKSTAAISDEQQAILAVRMAKASVVNIVGALANAPQTSNGNFLDKQLPPLQVSGTGWILDADGLIVTNNHVVDDSTLVYFVVMADGSQYPATIYGTDKFDDIALLKISAKNLTPAKLGDSDALETGQTVFAIGNSLGRYENTVTRGVVSGLGRAVDEDDDKQSPVMHNWIQTDAAINHGNSGGPLINLAGEVVGMNTLIDTAGSSLSFAVPTNIIKESIQQLKSFGKVSRPLLGIQFTTIDSRIRSALNLTVGQGALVIALSKGGVAEAAGVKINDVITAVGNEVLTIKNPIDVVIQKHQAGEQVTLKILRDGKNIDIPVILGEVK
ncbi:MAG TPA: trypsin-like peptidase domain-containing protein [Candidatus Limnocylindria bacterium]|nr:trypsin-like peptidase domain-containing protein [Candidatus Limnocylindria bacterium]